MDQRNVNRPARRASSAYEAGKLLVDCLAVVREHYAAGEIPEEVSSLFLRGIRSGTIKAYQSVWRCCIRWCIDVSCDPLGSFLNQVLQHLTSFYEWGKAYRTINVHRSMLSATRPTIDGMDGMGGKPPLLKRLLRAVYNQRTPMPKYSNFWDAALVTARQKELGLTVSLTLKQLTPNTVLLLGLTSFMCVAEIAVINLSSVHQLFFFHITAMQVPIVGTIRSI